MLETYSVRKPGEKSGKSVKMIFFAMSVFLLCSTGSLKAQNFTVSGTVSDDTGGKLIGVSVIIENTTTGTLTNGQGEFSITAPAGSTLVFTYLGYETQNVKVGNKTSLNITMYSTSVGMDEVVVVGYGTQSRRTMTSAISKLDGDAVKGSPITSVGEGMKGKIAGTRIYSNNNTPGADPVIRIRGGSSINMSNEPLILVDGVERAFGGINANDIESIETLKDAASTAVYGARGSNGVVLITTKTGKKNRAPRVTFEANVAFQQAERRFDLMGAEDYIRMVRTSVAEGPNPNNNNTSGFSASSRNDASSVYSTRYLKEGEAVPNGYKKMRDPLDNTKWLIFEDNDFQDVLFRNNFWRNYYVGVDGGSENATYLASIGYTTDDGVALGTEYDRFTALISSEINITKKLKFKGSMDYSDAKSSEFESQMNVISRGLSAAPTMKRYFEDGTPTYGYNGTSLNPEYNDYIFDRHNRNKRLALIGGLEYDILPQLKATVNGSIYNHVRRWGNFRKLGYFSDATPTSENFNELMRSKLDAYLTWKPDFANKNHSLNVMGGYAYTKDDKNVFGASAQGGGSDKTPTLTAQTEITNATSSFEKIVLISYFGRVNYDYKKKYLFTATFRADGSSKFVPGNQWGYFPAMSAGWMISEEQFMKPVTSVNDLKLRISYGETGNNAISLNDALGQYATNTYDGSPGLYPRIMSNADLIWEKTRQLDAGFDISMLKNRLMITADYFTRDTRSLIFSKDLPNTTGFSSVKTNIGKVRFYGFDVEIGSVNISKQDFSWDSKLTWSFVKNRVISLPDNGQDRNRIGGIQVGDGTAFGGTAEGEALYRLYGMKVAYVIRTEEQLRNAMYDDYSAGYNPADRTTQKGRKNMGDYEWVNRPGSTTQTINGEEVDIINSEDRFLLGYSVPHSTGGLSNTFRYKSLSLNIFMDWALGHTIMHAQMARQFINTFTGNTALNKAVLNTWSPENPDAKYARFYSGGESVSSNFRNNASIFAYKADYLCIREVSVSYELPQKWVSKLGMHAASVNVAGNNLHYFTAVPGVSPETGASSTNDANFYNYPPIRRVSLGLKVTF